jgi:small conductance mechanosensitive channel
MENVSSIMDKAISIAMDYGPKLIGALLLLFIGLWVIKIFTRWMGKAMVKADLEKSLHGFLKSMISALLKTLLIISVMVMVGIEMTSFIAILAAAGLAVGMALSGTLQNFAGGVMILLFRPFKVGDFIDAQGHKGTVKEIQIFNTILTTPDNVTIILPNGSLSGSAMTNFSTQPTRRVDMTFGIGYGDDIDKARKILAGLIGEDQRIMKDPEPFIAVSELADNSVNLVVRAWANSSDYWGVFFDMQEKVKKQFDAQGVSIPFPQTDVHLHQIQ